MCWFGAHWTICRQPFRSEAAEAPILRILNPHTECHRTLRCLGQTGTVKTHYNRQFNMSQQTTSGRVQPMVRAQGQEDLDERKHTIEVLYIDEDRKLPDVVEIMKEQYSFSAT